MSIVCTLVIAPNVEDASDDTVCADVTVSTVMSSPLVSFERPALGDTPGVGPWSPLMRGVLSLLLLSLLFCEPLDLFLFLCPAMVRRVEKLVNPVQGHKLIRMGVDISFLTNGPEKDQ